MRDVFLKAWPAHLIDGDISKNLEFKALKCGVKLVCQERYLWLMPELPVDWGVNCRVGEGKSEISLIRSNTFEGSNLHLNGNDRFSDGATSGQTAGLSAHRHCRKWALANRKALGPKIQNSVMDKSGNERAFDCLVGATQLQFHTPQCWKNGHRDPWLQRMASIGIAYWISNRCYAIIQR